MGLWREASRARWAAIVASALATVAISSACSSGADVTADELVAVVQRDGIVFDTTAIPDDVVAMLAANQVVLLGETHHLREHWAFVASLMGELHKDGFRQLLIEAPNMSAWLFDDYVQGGLLAPDWKPSAFWDTRLSGVAAVNEVLPPEERIHLRGIDANEEWYGGANGFRSMLGFRVGLLPDPGVEVSLPADYPGASPEAQTAAIDGLLATLAAGRSELEAAWSPTVYDDIVRMVEVESASIDIRTLRVDDDNAGATAREQVIKQLADESIAGCGCGTVINIGGHHAQKSHLMGTDQEWLGDYLVHSSSALDGPIMVINLASAKTELEPGAGGTPWDVRASASPDNELFRIMAETWPGQTVLLPLDDTVFKDRQVAFNSEDVIYATPIHEQYDALIQYGLAHRMAEG